MLEASPPNGKAHRPDVPTSPLLLEKFAEERFDRIVRIAAQSLDMPMALFALADGAHWWCKSRVGLTPELAAGLAGMYGDALSQPGLSPVNDALTEARLAAMLASAGAPHVRFCAGVPVRGPDGAIVGALCLFDHRPRDIDAGKRAMLADLAGLLERELAAGQPEPKSLQQADHDTATRGLLDDLPEGVVMLDANGVIVSCNAVAETMYGAATNGLIGRPASELTGEDPARLREALRAGNTNQLQAVARRIDGSEFIAEFSVKLLDTAGSGRYALAVRDISTRKEQELALRNADARRRKYFVTATHELRTPMASVLGFSELLLKRKFSAAEQNEMTGIIHHQATRLVNLINEMLDLARVESGGKDALDLRAQDAGAMLAQTLSGLEGLGAAQRIRCVLAPNLPPVLADAMKLQQALTNILSNAIKYSPASSEIRVDVAAAQLRGGSAVEFRIVDHGIGMTAAQKAQVFDPFYRAHSEPDTIGTGLGMTICREIVDLHGGRIQIESAPGVGTEIRLLLPAAVTPA